MDVKKVITMLAAREGISVAQLVRELSKYTGKEYLPQSFSSRLNTGTVRYNEVSKIAEMLGYKIKFIRDDEEING